MKQIILTITLLWVCSATNAQEVTDSTREALNDLRQEVDNLKRLRVQDSLNLAEKFRQDAIWAKSKPLIIGIGNQQMTDKTNGLKYKSNLSLSVAFRRTYYLHEKAIKGMMKFGLDVSFFDLAYARYAKGKGTSLGSLMGNVTSGTFQDYDEYFKEADEKALAARTDGMGNDILKRINIGKHSVTVGVAVGPSLKIVPFYPLNKRGLDKLKVTLYAHYVPSFSGVIMMADDTQFSGGYMGMWRYGINLSYSRIGIGVEHYKGKGKFHNFTSDDDDEGGDEGGSFINFSHDKIKYTFTGTRFYIGFRF